jgi:hypothetical protein
MLIPSYVNYCGAHAVGSPDARGGAAFIDRMLG